MRRIIPLVAWALFSGAAFAQTLPYHADPRAREDAPDLSLVPAIRFLTTADYPPFNYRDAGGRLIGFNIDLAQAICTTLSVACTVQAWPWDQAADALAENQGDALIAGLEISEITAERFDFSNPYMMFPARFVTAMADVPDFDAAGLDGWTIAVREGSAQARFLAAYFPQIVQMPRPTEIAALEAMQAGEARAYFGDALRAAFWLNEHIACCAFAGDAYFNERFFGEGLAVAVPEGRGTIRKAIDHALQRLQRDGTLDEIYLRWFPVSFY
jgi:polar amino acid transport system substrate-binding protein